MLVSVSGVGHIIYVSKHFLPLGITWLFADSDIDLSCPPTLFSSFIHVVLVMVKLSLPIGHECSFQPAHFPYFHDTFLTMWPWLI